MRKDGHRGDPGKESTKLAAWERAGGYRQVNKRRSKTSPKKFRRVIIENFDRRGRLISKDVISSRKPIRGSNKLIPQNQLRPIIPNWLPHIRKSVSWLSRMLRSISCRVI